MRFGLALPHYDSSIPGRNPLPFAAVLEWAQRAETLGFDSVWVSDHLTWDLAKYGADDTRYGVYEALVTLAAVARATNRVRLGSLVLCEALRPPAVLAKALAAIDRLSDGRLDVGLGAGWYEPDYEAIGTTMPPAGVRVARLAEALQIIRPLLSDGHVDFDGEHHRAHATNAPGPIQARVPVFVGGKGDRVLRTIARHADGWNTCWAWTPAAYRERLAVLDRACEAVGRDPATVSRSLGLYTLVGESDADLARRFERLATSSPPGLLAGQTLATWRDGRLVGTVEQVREQVANWADLGVETIVVGAGVVPFQLVDGEDVELMAAALRDPRSSESRRVP
jgi:probable F420-dependent oxidoreductase